MSVHGIVKTGRSEIANPQSTVLPAKRTQLNATGWRRWLSPLASMRLTVWLMVAAVFVILTFTFQLTKMDIWNAKSMHFPYLFVFIPFQTYFPPSWFPDWQSIPGGFYCPSGFLILSALLVNLFAAHLTRFRIVGQGWRLATGWLVIAAGIALALLVIFAGQNPDGFQAQPLVQFDLLWRLIPIALVGSGLVCLYQGWGSVGNQVVERTLWYSLGGGILSLALFLLIRGQAAFIGDAAMRILWQLIQCAVPSLMIIGGARWVFGRKAGMVAIHAGIAVLMLNEIYTSLTAVEQRIQFTEGEVAQYAYDLRHTELALVDSSDPGSDEHIVIPASRLQTGEVVRDEALPVDVMVVRYDQNSAIRGLRESDTETPATAGIGLMATYEPLRPVSGTKSEIDRPSAYVKFLDKQTQRDLGTYLVSEQLAAFEEETRNAPNVPKNTLTLGDQTYHMQLRFKRYYKPYRLQLIDTQQQTYLGSSTARYFSSEFQLTDRETGLDIREKVWMNNPLRYRNETFYQSGYDVMRDGTEVSTLQVVKNHGWMIPYFCCVLVGLGLLTHFSGTLHGFLNRRKHATRAIELKPTDGTRNHHAWYREPGTWMLVAVPLLSIGWAMSAAATRSSEPGTWNVHQLGSVPMVQLGRAKPMDTVARSLLRRCSGYEQIKREHSDRKRIDPMVWMTDALMGGTDHLQYELFRIDNPSLRNALGLDPRPGFRYTLAEILKAEKTLNELVEKLTQRPEEDWNEFEHRTAELASLVRECQSVGRWLQVDWDGERLLDLYFWKVLPDLARPDQPYIAPLFGQDGQSWGTLATAIFAQTALQRAQAWGVSDCRSLAERIVSDELSAIREYELKLRLFQQITKDPRLAGDMPGMSETQIQMFIFEQLQNAPLAELESRAGSLVQLIDEQLEVLSQPHISALADDLTKIFGSQDLPAQRPAYDVSLLAALPKYYDAGDEQVDNFNAALSQYLAGLQHDRPSGFVAWKIRWEEFYNRLAPYYRATILYFFALILSLFAWLGATSFLNRLASSVLLGGTLIHLLGVILAVGISGRPPVTGLYSSFVFVTLGVVNLFLGIEFFARFGIGNLLASLVGIGGLLWAWNIALGTADTFSVMVAVLDTNFWLSTHVLCISTGYVATLAAGILGAAYLLGSRLMPVLDRPQPLATWGLAGLTSMAAGGGFVYWANRSATMIGTSNIYLVAGAIFAAVTGLMLFFAGINFGRWLDQERRQKAIKTIYGITCFALICSFVGTVLGGLWADDSWGRFWGWDPKENGAMMIVLWNAVLLHARWSGLAREAGIAALAVLGNIVVTWSWEGVNQLGVGLHAYALSDANKFNWLLGFWISQLILACLVFWPRSWGQNRQLAGS